MAAGLAHHRDLTLNLLSAELTVGYSAVLHSGSPLPKYRSQFKMVPALQQSPAYFSPPHRAAAVVFST